jgi:integrase
METTTVSTSSINIYLRAVAGFLNWASDEDNNYIPKKNYIKKYKQKENQKIKPPYTENEYNLLLAYFQNVTQNLEMCLLLQFLWHTGARVGETLNIKLTDLDLLNNRIIVNKKKNKCKQELQLLTPEAVKIVEEAKEFAILRGDKKLFSWKETRLLNRIVERAERNIGIKKEGRGLHGFRRAFTRKLAKNKITIPDMQDILRHKSIGITMKHYNEYRPEELVEEMSKKL